MAKPRFAWTEIALGAVVSLLLLLVFWMQWAEGVEGKLYDVRARLRARPKTAENVMLVGIDDDSIRQIGRWPWPRSYMADMVDQLAEAQAKVIGVDIFFPDAELNPGLQEVRRMKEEYAAKVAAAGSGASVKSEQEFVGVLESAEKRLNNDARLEDSLALAQNTVLPMYFALGRPAGKVDKPVADELSKNFMASVWSDGSATSAQDFTPPYERFARVAKAIGQANLTPSSDGVQRAVPLVVDFNGKLFPSFSLQVLRAYYGLESDDYRYTPDRELVLGRAHVPVDAQGRMLVDYAELENLSGVKFSDVRNKKVPPEVFAGKIVLIGMMATGGGDLYTSPLGTFPGMAIHANVIQNIINRQYLVRPTWARNAELALLLVFALFVSLVIPRMKASYGALVTIVLLALSIGGGIYLFTAYGYWLKTSYPALLLVAGYVVVISKCFLGGERRTSVLETEPADTNRVLGLSFQAQGMLDMAFDKFRKCPVTNSMKETLYGLALDFERKRKFKKAVRVLDHIATVDENYKDIAERSQKLRGSGDTVILEPSNGMKAGADSTLQ